MLVEECTTTEETMNTIGTTSLLLAGLLSMQGCASSTHDTDSRVPPERMTNYIHIDNDGTLDADVYVVSGGQAWRLDLVTALQQATVRMPIAVTPGMEIRALVDPIGSFGAYLSDPLQYTGDEDYELRIASSLPLTSFYPTILSTGRGK